MKGVMGVKTGWIGVVLALAAILALEACREFPTRPVNRGPAISAVVVFPDTIGQGDSAIVTVLATDPDGDTLVYDWVTDGRLIIKGGNHAGSLFHTASSSRVFYRSTSIPYNNDAWVECGVRDVRGGADYQVVRIQLRD